jgi:uncharacterized membrane protein
MAKELEMVAATYQDEERGKTILDMLEQMHRARTIDMVDAAMLKKDADGKVTVVETHELTGKGGAKRGAIAGAVLGVIFPPSLIASAVLGGAAGAAWGKLRDTGIKSKAMEDLGNSLEPGKTAVVTLVKPESVKTVENALKGYDGKLVKHAFSANESEQIEAAGIAAAGSADAPGG